MDNETDLSFKRDEIRKLKRLLGTLRAFASKNRSLVKKLGLENKLVETIREGMVSCSVMKNSEVLLVMNGLGVGKKGTT
jgi:hypothetical protein